MKKIIKEIDRALKHLEKSKEASIFEEIESGYLKFSAVDEHDYVEVIRLNLDESGIEYEESKELDKIVLKAAKEAYKKRIGFRINLHHSDSLRVGELIGVLETLDENYFLNIQQNKGFTTLNIRKDIKWKT